MYKSISRGDLELLSSFLDDQLSPSELKRLQARLVLEEELQTALHGLRRTKIILSALPHQATPRDFFIPPTERKPRFDLYQYFQVFRLSAVGAALILIILLTLDFFTPSLRMAASPADQAARAPAARAASETMADKPTIITWGSPQEFAFGRGGGGETVEPSETGTVPQAASLEDAGKAPDDAASAPMLELSVSPPLDAAPPVSGTGPILGIPPSALRGVVPTLSPMTVEAEAASFNMLRLLQIGFAMLTVLMAWLALLVRRRLG